jgi:two-component system sensor histidine kinase NreB
MNIVLIDDDEVFSILFKKILENTEIKANIYSFINGSSFLAYGNFELIDFLFIDFNLPDFNALGLIATLQSSAFNAPIVVLTGMGDEKKAVNIMKAGAFDYLLKDEINTELIKHVIRSGLQLFKARKEEKEVQLKLIESEKRYRTLIETMEEGLVQLNCDEEIISANQKFCSILGLRLHEVIDKKLDNVLVFGLGHQMSNSLFSNNLDKLIGNQQEFKLLHKNGSIIWVLCTGSSLYNSDGESIGSFFIFNDITDRKEVEMRILNTVIETQEIERKRISEDLHDGIGQKLTAVMLNLSVIDSPELSIKNKIAFDNCVNFVDEAILETRNLSHMLLPKVLHDFGFIYAVEDIVEKMNITKELSIEFYYSKSELYHFNIDINMFRIVQEAISNSIKHGKSDCISIHLDNRAALLHLYIVDNGVGFDAENFDIVSGLGLLNIKKRAEFLGGSVEIKSNLGKGTSIEITVPKKLKNKHLVK